MEEELTPQQLKAIALIVARDVNGMTYQVISEEVGVSNSTLSAWRHKPAFRNELNAKAQEVADTYLTQAYKTVSDVLNNPNSHDRDKLKATEIVLKNQGKLSNKHEVEVHQDTSMSDLLARLDKL